MQKYTLKLFIDYFSCFSLVESLDFLDFLMQKSFITLATGRKSELAIGIASCEGVMILFSDEQLNKTKQRSQICSKEFSGHQSVCKPLILVSFCHFFSLEIVLYPTFSLWCTPSYTDRIVSQPIFTSFTDKKLQNLQLYLSTFATK